MNHDDEDVLRDELRAIASWGDPDGRPGLDDLAAGPPVSGGSARSDRSRWLAAAALAAAAAVFVVAFIATRDGDETEVLTGPAATTAPETSPSTAPPATTAPDTTPPTAPPATEPTIDGESLPAAGVAIRRDAGPLTLLDLDGNVLGTADATNVPVITREVSIGIGSPPQLGPAVPVAAEVPTGCDSASADGGVHVALCGGETGFPRRIERIDPAGGSTEISGPPPRGDAQAVRGHWRWAEPSPDGRWVLAAWSGECESVTGFLFPTDGGNGVTANGSPIDEWQTSPEAAPLGWTLDGRAIVAHGHGLCGAGAAEPGVHLMDPTTGATERIYQSEIGDGFLTWIRRYPWGNGLEYLAIQALDDLGFEQCCGEPSHGGPDATIGAVFEGTNIAILGAPIEDSTLNGVESTERIPFGPGQAVVFDGEAGRSIAFACGNNTWTISWTILNPPPADVDKMLRLGEALLPHLACTLGAPPT